MKAQDLLEHHAPAWHEATCHPFLDAVRDGTLSWQAFATWLVQDYLFVRDVLVFQARLLAQAPRADQAVLVRGLVAIEAELGWFEEQAERRSLDLQAPRQPTGVAYRDFLLRFLEHEPYPAAITTLWALERAYLEAWRGATPGHPEYREFVEHWTTPDFAEYVAELERAADRALEPGGEMERVEAAFLNVARLERDFWEMAFSGGSADPSPQHWSRGYGRLRRAAGRDARGAEGRPQEDALGGAHGGCERRSARTRPKQPRERGAPRPGPDGRRRKRPAPCGAGRGLYKGGAMARYLTIRGEEADLKVDLGGGPTAEEIWGHLPFEGPANFWGDEIYFEIPVSVEPEDEAREAVEVGDVCYWPQGEALCIFFGPTPASTDENTRAASPVTVVGRVSEVLDDAERIESGEILRVEGVEE